jgi:hypothetical protein
VGDEDMYSGPYDGNGRPQLHDYAPVSDYTPSKLMMLKGNRKFSALLNLSLHLWKSFL